jgi:hypothetical protein
MNVNRRDLLAVANPEARGQSQQWIRMNPPVDVAPPEKLKLIDSLAPSTTKALDGYDAYSSTEPGVQSKKTGTGNQ